MRRANRQTSETLASEDSESLKADVVSTEILLTFLNYADGDSGYECSITQLWCNNGDLIQHHLCWAIVCLQATMANCVR